MIPRETVDAIIDAARIEEVVGDFVALKKRGANMWGNCPFHNEKTPSFSVNPVRGIYKCFGCGKGGNAVNFVMEHEKFTYPEALRYLAKKYQIDIQEQEETAEQIAAKTEREGLLAITDFAAKYFNEQLLETDLGKSIGLSYFYQRGFSDDTIRKFQLGYSPEAWDAFTQHALKQGYSLEMLERSGLSIVKEGRQYDRFRDRVIFPIHNQSGKVIGFGGRLLSSDKTKPKYVNSPESEIYDKKKTLYGIAFAKNAIVANDLCYLVEGYTDVISLHQASIQNVVASSGTSLTEDQIRLIKRYSDNITILYDGDTAGIKASFRGIDMILSQGMNVRVVLFPDGEDPDSYARSHTSSELDEFLQKSAKDFISFKIDLLLDETGSDPIKRAAVVRDFIESIALIPDRLVRMAYVKESAERMQMDESVINAELNKILRKKASEKFKGKESESSETTGETQTLDPEAQEILLRSAIRENIDFTDSEYQEREIIRLLLLHGTKRLPMYYLPEGHTELQQIDVRVADMIVFDLQNDEISFHNPTYTLVFNEVARLIKDGFEPEEAHFTHHPDLQIMQCSIDVVSFPYELANWEKKLHTRVPLESDGNILPTAINHTLLSFKAKRVEKLLEENRQQLKTCSNDDEIMMLLAKNKELQNIKTQINNLLGRVISH